MLIQASSLAGVAGRSASGVERLRLREEENCGPDWEDDDSITLCLRRDERVLVGGGDDAGGRDDGGEGTLKSGMCGSLSSRACVSISPVG